MSPSTPIPRYTPSPPPSDTTDLAFEWAVATLDEACRQRLLRPTADYNAEILRINKDAKKQQTADNTKYGALRTRYQKQLAKRPQDLAAILATIDAQAINAAARIQSLSSHSKTVALGIRRRATEAINEYRLHRLVSLRTDMESRLKSSRLQESLQSRKLQQQKETEALCQQHRLVVSRLQEFLHARKLQQKKETGALRQQLRQQHCLVVSRLKEVLSCSKEKKPLRKPAFDTNASFPLQEYFLAQPPIVPGTLTTQIGPLCLSPTEAASMRAIQDTPIDNSTPRVLYSDGSLLNSGTMEVSQAFGVVDLSQDTPLTMQGRTDGHASSAKAELMGLLIAVLSAPPEQDIVVKLDNESVVERFESL
ncbi:hypothetical protein BGX24_006465, partial [Mortierella sp. AD032]